MHASSAAVGNSPRAVRIRLLRSYSTGARNWCAAVTCLFTNEKVEPSTMSGDFTVLRLHTLRWAPDTGERVTRTSIRRLRFGAAPSYVEGCEATAGGQVRTSCRLRYLS